MSRPITNSILAFLVLFGILFLIPTYFGAHSYYQAFFGQLFPPLHLLWMIILPLVVVWSVLGALRYYQQRPITTIAIRPITLIGSLILGLLLLFNIYGLHPSSTVFRTYTEDFAEVQTRVPAPTSIAHDELALSRFYNGQRETSWRTAEEVFPAESLWIPHLWLTANANFLGHILLISAALLLIVLSAYNIGTTALQLLRFHRQAALEEENTGPRTLLSIAVGISLWIGILFILGSMQLLITPVLWGVILLSLCLYRSTLRFVQILWQKVIYTTSLFSIEPILATVLWLFVVMTAYQLFRPIPIGWDDMSVYMNIPHLISQSGGLISGHSAHGWSLFMSLGFLLLQSTVLTMMLSWLGGVLVLLGFMHYSKSLFSGRAGLLMATIFASLPMVLFQMSQDMKIDMGLLFIGMSSLYVFLRWWHKGLAKDDTHFIKQFQLLFLAGALLGVAFSIKYTTFLLCCVYIFLLGQRFFGWVSLPFSLGVLGGVMACTRFTDILGFPISTDVYQYIGIASIVLLLGSVLWVLYRRPVRMYTRACALLIFLVCVALPVAPWIVKHHMETNSWQISALLSGGHTTPTLTGEAIVLTEKIEEAPTETPTATTTTNTPQAPRDSGVLVELGRYSGYETGWFSYLSLPYTQTMNSHVQGQYVDISFLFLFFIPLALLLLPKGRHTLWWNSSFTLIYILLTVATHGAMSADAQWYVGSMFQPLVELLQAPAGSTAFLWTGLSILLLGVVYFWAFWRGCNWETHHKIVLLGALLYWILWAVLGSGVIWYGIFGFIPLLALLAYVDHTLRADHTALSYGYILRFLLCGIILFWLGTSLCNKLATIDTPGFALYKAGVSAEETIDTMLPSYRTAAEIINEDPEAFVYRLGTFLPYFITANNTRVLTDNQLDHFHNYYVNADKEQPEAFLERLRRSHMKYIALDLNISTIDQTENKSLIADHKRVLTFINSVQSSLEVVAHKLQDTTIEQLREKPPRIGSTLVFYTREGTLYRVYTTPQDLTIPVGTQRVAVGQGSGALIVWKIN